MPEHSDLKKIGHLYQTDKIDHGYLEIYENYFNKLQNKNLTILEIGIADGKSLLMWSDYFKNSKIIGIDSSIEKIAEEDRSKPKNLAPVIVTPALLAPGIKAKT